MTTESVSLNPTHHAQLDQNARAEILARGIGSALAADAWALIERARRILIMGHEHPDPDALGSSLGLAHALRAHGKSCVVACADPVPENYTFLPGRDQVVTSLPDQDFDLVIALDAGELSRYGSLYTRYRPFFDSATILNIDHHVTSAGCGQVNIIDPVSAATAELLTLFLLNRGIAIGEDAAKCLLAGIITDTRSFEFDATTPRTLTAGAYLVGCGAVSDAIIKPMYRMKPLAKAVLWGHALRAISSVAGGRIVWATLRQEDFAASGASADMDDGLSSYLMDIDGVAFAALFKEQEDGRTKVSLRAAAPHDAAAIAAHFGGGGHVRAAGCTIEMRVDDAITVLIPYIESRLSDDDDGKDTNRARA